MAQLIIPPPRQATRGRLVNWYDPTDQLIFQYNPQWTESKSAKWAEATIPGGDDSLATFGAGSSLELPMTFFFNTHGEGEADLSGYARNVNDPFALVDDAIEFFYRFSETDRTGATPGRAPGVLLLAFGSGTGGVRFPGARTDGIGSMTVPALPVRIRDLSVDRQLFNKVTWRTTRAEIKATLVRHRGFPR